MLAHCFLLPAFLATNRMQNYLIKASFSKSLALKNPHSNNKPMTKQTTAVIPPNENYGKGTYRRRILMRGLPGRVIAELEDCFHGFRVTIEHNNSAVSNIVGEALRTPMNTCEGAMAPIKALIGTHVSTPNSEFSSIANPRSNCTHLYDLTVMAIGHACRGEIDRQYDIIIHDEKDGIIDARVLRNEQLVLRWQVSDGSIQKPTEVAGKPALKGFSKWASNSYEGDDYEAALALHKGYFVALALRWNMSAMEGCKVTDYSPRLGICYTYSEGVVEDAYRNRGAIRDFSDTPEALLEFK